MWARCAVTLLWGAVTQGVIAPIGRNQVFRMVLDGDLIFDMDKPLSLDTKFDLVSSGPKQHFLGRT